MKRVLATLITALLFSTASALTLPQNAHVTLISESGITIGVGELNNGNLSLTLEVDASGFVTLIIMGEGGEIVSLDGMIDAQGQVLVLSEGDLEDLVESVEAAGGQAEVAFNERIAGGVQSITDLPDQAEAGIEKAISNHQAAMGRAASAKTNANSEGEAEVGEEAEAEAEGSLETGVAASIGGIAGTEAAAEAEIGISIGAGAATGANRR